MWKVRPSLARREKRAHDVGGELLDDLVHAAGGGSRVSLDREECLGHRHRNLAGVEWGDRAVAADHLHRRLRFRRGERLGPQLDAVLAWRRDRDAE